MDLGLMQLVITHLMAARAGLWALNRIAGEKHSNISSQTIDPSPCKDNDNKNKTLPFRVLRNWRRDRQLACNNRGSTKRPNKTSTSYHAKDSTTRNVTNKIGTHGSNSSQPALRAHAIRVPRAWVGAAAPPPALHWAARPLRSCVPYSPSSSSITYCSTNSHPKGKALAGSLSMAASHDAATHISTASLGAAPRGAWASHLLAPTMDHLHHKPSVLASPPPLAALSWHLPAPDSGAHPIRRPAQSWEGREPGWPSAGEAATDWDASMLDWAASLASGGTERAAARQLLGDPHSAGKPTMITPASGAADIATADNNSSTATIPAASPPSHSFPLGQPPHLVGAHAVGVAGVRKPAAAVAAAAALSSAGSALGGMAERAVEGPVRGLRKLNRTVTDGVRGFLASDSGRRLSEQVAAEMSSGALMAPVYLTEELVKARLRSLVASHARWLAVYLGVHVSVATTALHAVKASLARAVRHRGPPWLRSCVSLICDILLPTGFFGPLLGVTVAVLKLTGRGGGSLKGTTSGGGGWPRNGAQGSALAGGDLPAHQPPLASALPAVAAVASDAVAAASETVATAASALTGGYRQTGPTTGFEGGGMISE